MPLSTTFMRANNVPDAYERLKAVTRGKSGGVGKEDVMSLLNGVRTDENKDEVDRLLKMTPLTYTGTAEQLALEVPKIVGEIIGKK